jgi:hypothetical protein
MMDANVKVSQQDKDRRTQDALTGSVGVRLQAREKPTGSRWSTVKRLLRIG